MVLLSKVPWTISRLWRVQRFPFRCNTRNGGIRGAEASFRDNAGTHSTQTHSCVASDCGACVLLNEMYDISELPCLLLQQQKSHSEEWILS